MVNKKTKTIKIIKIILTVICSVQVLLFTLMFAYCSYLSNQKYTCDVDSVESIEIVRIKWVKEKQSFDFTILSTVTDHEEFFERIYNMEQEERHLHPPAALGVDSIVIRINYNDGGYDIISNDVQVCFCMDYDYDHDQNIYFDVEEFDLLINDYLEKE